MTLHSLLPFCLFMLFLMVLSTLAAFPEGARRGANSASWYRPVLPALRWRDQTKGLLELNVCDFFYWALLHEASPWYSLQASLEQKCLSPCLQRSGVLLSFRNAASTLSSTT
jgi:hypothetical protein